jgi:hypothetical protein
VGFFCSWYRHVHLMPEQRPPGRSPPTSVRPARRSAPRATRAMQPARWTPWDRTPRPRPGPWPSASTSPLLHRPVDPPSTPRCATPNAWPKPPRSPRSDPPATPRTAPWPNPRTRCSRPSWSATQGRSRATRSGHRHDREPRDVQLPTAERRDRSGATGRAGAEHLPARQRGDDPSPRWFRASTEPGADIAPPASSG